MANGTGKLTGKQWAAIVGGALLAIGVYQNQQQGDGTPGGPPGPPGLPLAPNPSTDPVTPTVPVAKPPVDLNIPNIRQETEVWCWIAVSQQIIAATRGSANTPQQCALVAAADNLDPATCCQGYNRACVHTGQLEQISGLIQKYGGRTSAIMRPGDAMWLYNELATGHAVIMGLQLEGGGHVIVARGMTFMPTRNGDYEPLVTVNDPMQVFTQPVPFRALWPVWTAAVVIN